VGKRWDNRIATLMLAPHFSIRASWGVIFDLDGVIAHTNPYHGRAIKELCRRCRRPITDQVLREKVFGIPNRVWLQTILGPGLSEEQVDNYANAKEEIFRTLSRGSLKPLPGLTDIVKDLFNHNIPLAVASSAPRSNIDMILAETNLAEFFKVILDENSVKRGKPSPDIYERAAHDLSLDPHCCLVFEDSEAGIEAAQRAGCVVIGVSTTHSPAQLGKRTRRVIADFKQLCAEDLGQLMSTCGGQ
jgi:HAD superfamily hydrolase (TIGR01509 family)